LNTHILNRSLSPEEGQAMVEYALILGFVAVACVGALSLIGAPLIDIFEAVASGF